MKEFLMTLLFSKTMLLTPTPITLEASWNVIVLEAPLSAVNRGAAVYVDVTSYVQAATSSSHQNDLSYYQQLFPADSMRAELATSDGVPIKLVRSGFVYRPDQIRLKLAPSDSSMPTDKKFSSLRIWSDRTIGDAKVIWQNGGK
jgi:hypothetical protein